jgi:uncharacterized protein with PQ loop repeat
MIQAIGYLATFITGLSFMMKDIKTLRLVNALGCLIWIVYGAAIDSTPVIITNVGIFSIHLAKLLKEINNKNK